MRLRPGWFYVGNTRGQLKVRLSPLELRRNSDHLALLREKVREAKDYVVFKTGAPAIAWRPRNREEEGAC
jgi:hypothetical protein